jgi:flagellar biosynthesis/type III secretory pathway M-ring protein FliF/YscJ
MKLTVFTAIALLASSVAGAPIRGVSLVDSTSLVKRSSHHQESSYDSYDSHDSYGQDENKHEKKEEYS